MFSSGRQLWKLDKSTFENKANLLISSGWSFEYGETESLVYIRCSDGFLSMESNGTIYLINSIDNSTSQLWFNVSYTDDGYFTLINVASSNSLLTSTSIQPLTLEGKLSTNY